MGAATLHDESSYISHNIFGGYMEATTTFGGIRFKFSSGNINLIPLCMYMDE